MQRCAHLYCPEVLEGGGGGLGALAQVVQQLVAQLAQVRVGPPQYLCAEAGTKRSVL
jgi:hypothetical protein